MARQQKYNPSSYDQSGNSGDYVLRGELNTLFSQLEDTRSTLDQVREKLITINAEYTNDKEWVHTSLRDVMATQDKALDRISRLEGKFDNGVNKMISDLKEQLLDLREDVEKAAKSSEVSDIERRLKEETAKLDYRIDQAKDEQRDDVRGLEANTKSTWAGALKVGGLILSIVGQLILFITLIVTLMSL